MNKAGKLLSFITSMPFGHEDLNKPSLIGFGESIGLPSHVNMLGIEENLLGEYSISGVFDMIAVPQLAKFKKTPDGWTFSIETWPNAFARVGDWWPAHAYIRLQALIKEIPDTLSGPKLTTMLTEIASLGAELGWSMDAFRHFCGGCKKRRFEDVLMSVANNFTARLSPSCYGRSAQLAILTEPVHSTFSGSFKLRDIRWLSVFEALIDRLTNIVVGCP